MSLVSHRKLASGGAAILLIAFGAVVWAYYHKDPLS